MGSGQRPGLDVAALNGGSGDLVARDRPGQDFIRGDRVRSQFVCRDDLHHEDDSPVTAPQRLLQGHRGRLQEARPALSNQHHPEARAGEEPAEGHTLVRQESLRDIR